MSQGIARPLLGGADPWSALQLDSATERLAERAAAAAELSVEEWLERAIRRACGNLPAEAISAVHVAPLVPPTSPRSPEEARHHRVVERKRSGGASRVRGAVLLGAGIAMAIAAGVISAQYLIPNPPSATQVALAPAIPGDKAQNPASPPRVAASAPVVPAPVAPMPLAPAGAERAAPAPAAATTPAAPPPETSAAPPASSLEPAQAPPSAAAASAGATSPAAPSAPQATAHNAAPAKQVAALSRPTAKPSDQTAVLENAEPPSDPGRLVPWLAQRADAGDGVAQYRLGVLYALGEGVAQDYQHAAALFKSSAELGVPEAQYNIAVMYGEGLGVDRDPVEAVNWYRKAATQGSASAAFNLGVAYSNGTGVEQSMKQAAEWFRRAAEAGIVNAQFNLGLLYERGDGVPPSQVEAFAWYAVAAAHGDTGAAQRRDRLAGALAPNVLKAAQTRAQQVQASIETIGPVDGAAAMGPSVR